MRVERIAVGYLQANCYALIKDNDCLLIDPGDDYFVIKENIKNLNLLGIIITHRHKDHIGALQEFIDLDMAKVYDISNLQEKEYNIGNFKFNVIYTMGHTTDSISIYFEAEKMLFTGDFLFQGTIGRTDLETGSTGDMQKSISRIKKYDPEITVYPGHGIKTNLGYEIKHNHYFK